MKNYEKIADFCNEDPVLFQQAFVAFAGLGAVKMKHLTPAMFDDKNDLSDEDIEKVVEMAKLMAELSSDALFAIIQRNLPAVEGDDKEVPFLHEFGDEDDICPCCGAEIKYCGEHDPDDSGYTIDWECPECGATGKAGYTAVFARHYKVRDAIGHDVPGRDH